MIGSLSVVALLAAAIPAAAAPPSASAAADSDSAAAVAERPPTRFGIVRTHLPASPGGPQLAVSLARYVANFGSRDGVKPGSIFQAYSGTDYVGLLRVEVVYRDSSMLRLVRLVSKADAASPEPVSRGHLLYPKYVMLESVNFGTGKPDLSADMHERLRYAARFILDFPDFPVILEGHTDNVGKKEDNVKLALERARSIGQYLNDIQRVPLSQLFPVGYADERPLVGNDTEAGRIRNRRVDIVMVDVLPPEAVPPAAPPPAPAPAPAAPAGAPGKKR